MKKNSAWLKETPFAHRGLFGGDAPENSLTAIRRAKALGFPVEIDVQATRDGRVVVFHDWSLERMTGHGSLVVDTVWKDLSQLRLNGTQEAIPSLEHVLEEVNGQVGLLIEIKNRGRVGMTESAIASVLDKSPGAFAIQSFNPRTVLWFKNHRPRYLRGQISCHFETDPMPAWKKALFANYATNGFTTPDFIAHDWRRLPALIPMAIKRFLRLPLLGWTVRSQREQDACLAWADNTIFEGFVPREGGRPE
ncbi:MAG: glycerophosphodiester phosphodiesterase family protein [Terrimicrobiaceae bacterium]